MSIHHAPNSARKRKLKARIIERDGMACFYCRTPFPTAADATLDHLVPQSAVPGWRAANLVLACVPCNQAKADALPQALLRPVGYGPGLVPVASGSRAPGATGTPHLTALAGAA
jgi:5-methylcytosine-specific restriction endonuclease McrA